MIKRTSAMLLFQKVGADGNNSFLNCAVNRDLQIPYLQNMLSSKLGNQE